MPIQIHWEFYHQKRNFSDKNSDIFLVSAVYPWKPQVYYIIVGFKGVKIIQACFRGVGTIFGALNVDFIAVYIPAIHSKTYSALFGL